MRSEGLRIAACVVPVGVYLWSLLSKALKMEMMAEPDLTLARSRVESPWG